MKKLTAAIAATIFAAGVSASDIYHGLDEGNPDLTSGRLSAEDFAGVQPSIGDSIDFHHGLADGNSDLSPTPASGVSHSGEAPDVYNLFRGNPDLSY